MAAEKVLILGIKMHGKHQYCSYVRAYFKAKGLNVGDTWVVHEYQEWITQKHEQFRQIIHSPCCLGYNQEQKKEFEKFILQENVLAPENF